MSYGMRGKIISASLTFLVLMLWMSSHVFAADLETVRHAIKEKGAHWVAEETEFAKLPLQEKKLRLGLIKPSRTGAERVLASEVPLTGLTASFDWSTGGRYADGKNYVTPVRNQRSCGSCWAFATTGALESYTLISSGDSLCNLSSCDLSEQVLVSCGKAGSCSGGYVSQASDYIRDTGLPVESCYPYLASNGTCSNSCPTWNTSTYRIGAWYYVATTSPTATAIKNALYSYGPLATTMDVYEDFYDFYDSGVYSYVSGGYVGGHAILIVGYADNSAYPGGGFFRVKNSWGTGWGESGYFYMSYYDKSLEIGAQFYDAEPLTTYTRAYQYDPLGLTTSVGFTGGDRTMAWYSNIFMASANAPTIKAVGTYALSPNASYTVEIWKNVAPGKPRSGTKVATKSGTLAKPGYNTILLTTPAVVAANKPFSVVVKMTNPGNNWPVPIESTASGYSSAASSCPGQSFLSHDGTVWTDASGDPDPANNFNVCLKALAVK